MGNTIANVLVGVASLAIRQPNDALAKWVTDQYYAGSHSVKLSKGGSGNAGSTHLQLDPIGANVALTLQQMEDAVVAGTPEFSFYHKCQNGVTGNFVQLEMRFEDPNSEGWIEVTFVNQQNKAGDGVWAKETLATGDMVGYGGISDAGLSFFEWGLCDISGLVAAAEDAGVANCTLGDWVLSRIRLELWEPTPARYVHVDTVVIHGVTYEIEPGAATAAGLSLSGPYTDVGYTEDGVTFDYGVDTADIEVEEETFPVERRITKETLGVTCNMAESSLFNIDKAIAGSVLSGSKITIGAGVLKKMSIKLEGTNPAGYARSIALPLVTATGAVGMSYKKGEKTVVPVTFQALKPMSGSVCTIVDNAA